jgi:hypothetical protein
LAALGLALAAACSSTPTVNAGQDPTSTAVTATAPGTAPPGTDEAGAATPGSTPDDAGGTGTSTTDAMTGNGGATGSTVMGGATTSSAVTPSTSATATTAPGAPPTTQRPTSGTTTPAIGSKPTTTLPGAAVSTDPADAAFCAYGRDLKNQFANMDPEKDPTGALAQLKAAYAKLQQLAPAAVKAAMTTINDAMQATKTISDLEHSETAEVKAAEASIDAWAVTHCGAKFGD